MRPPKLLLKVPESEFEEIEPIADEKGRTLRRVRHKLTGAIGTEVPRELMKMGEVEVQPMKVPSGSIFYQEFEYGILDDDKSQTPFS